jgi:hypothetical protein
MQHHLKHKAKEFEEEKRNEMRVGMVNIISDTVTLCTFFVTLALGNEGREMLTNTIGRVSQGMSQTGKAFVLILVADILMGYHSEEGWTAGILLLSEHYGIEPEVCSHHDAKCSMFWHSFVSSVVLIDVVWEFWWWLFKQCCKY